MKIVYSYLIRSYFSYFSIVSAVLFSIVWVVEILSYLNILIASEMPIRFFLSILFLTIPAILSKLLPLVLLVSSVYMIYVLQRNSTIISLYSLGYTRKTIFKVLVTIAGFVLLIHYVISLIIMPYTDNKISELKHYVRNHYSTILLHPKSFTQNKNSITVYIDSKDKVGNMYDVFIQAKDNENIVTIITAKEAKVISEDKLFLKDGMIQRFNSKDEKLMLFTFQEYYLDLSLIKYLKKNSIKNNNKGIKIADSLFYPMYDLAIIFLMLSLLRSRVHNLKYIIVFILGIGIIMSFFAWQKISKKYGFLFHMLYITPISIIAIGWMRTIGRKRIRRVKRK